MLLSNQDAYALHWIVFNSFQNRLEGIIVLKS